MKCPYCSNENSKVTNKRESPEGIRRRRECLKCGKRFTTYERVSENNLYIIKKDKRREKFDREKLKCGIEKAFEKRAVSKEKIEKCIRKCSWYGAIQKKMRLSLQRTRHCQIRRFAARDTRPFELGCPDSVIRVVSAAP